jgi:uncharacterized protein
METRERRITTVEAGEVRATKREDGSTGITGSAIVFDSLTVIGGQWQEVVRAEAVDGLLEGDTRGLFNHDPNFPLARNGRTMTLEKRDDGLWYDIPELPKSRADVAEAVERGDVTGNSFSFTMPADGSGERWIRPADRTDGGTRPLRELLRFAAIYDVGPVTFPAYEATTVSTRAKDMAAQVAKAPPPAPPEPWGPADYARERARLARARAECDLGSAPPGRDRSHGKVTHRPPQPPQDPPRSPRVKDPWF